MRRLVAMAAAVVAGLVVARKVQEQQEEQDLWAQVTDPAPASRPTS
ncbi:MAG: DLW-39 family protein [Actinobacteria bacterium]|nr:DLW-39 family protein [Actinomycetota bacterium]